MYQADIEKLISFLEANRDLLTNWNIKFANDLKKVLQKNKMPSEKQLKILINEVKRVLFINFLNDSEV